MSDLNTLRQQWQSTFGFAPPPLMSPEFMAGNLAYHRQCKIHGGLSSKTLKALLSMAEGKKTARPRQGLEARPGTTLIRMWQGEAHEVTVDAPDRFTYRGIVFASLSAIANHITGTRWNGHAFFGLRKKSAT